MSALSKQITDAIINHLLRAVQHNSPATVYLALHDSGGGVPAAPGDIAATAFVNEFSYTSYARKAITFSAPTGTNNSVVANDVAVIFDAVDSGEGPVNLTGFSLWSAPKGVDAGSSGQMIYQWPVDTVKSYADADAPTVAVGGIQLSLD